MNLFAITKQMRRKKIPASDKKLTLSWFSDLKDFFCSLALNLKNIFLTFITLLDEWDTHKLINSPWDENH